MSLPTPSPLPPSELPLPPAEAPSASVAPPAPRSAPAPARMNRRRRWTLIGAALGLAVGLYAGKERFAGQPAEFQSVAQVQVSGPPEAADAAAQASLAKSPPILENAAHNLDEFRPFEQPPPKSTPARITQLAEHLTVEAAPSSDATGSTLKLTFHSGHSADTPKYLHAVIEAYRAELAARSEAIASIPAPRAAPVPTPPVPPTAPSPRPAAPSPDPLAEINAEEQRVKSELAGLTTEDAPAIEARLTANRAAITQIQARLQNVERELALIRDTGPKRQDRLATMRTLGVKPDTPDTPMAPSPEARAVEEQLHTLELRKAELGQRLGPDHRDMIALDEQMQFLKARLAKLAPATPIGPDELERYRVRHETDRAALAVQLGVLTAATARDEKLLADGNALRAKLAQLAANRRVHTPPAALPPSAPATAPQPITTAPPEVPAPPALPAGYTVRTLAEPTAGVRVSTPLYLFLLPPALAGLLAGGFVGFMAFQAVNTMNHPRRTLPPAVRPRSPKPPRAASPLPSTAPKLNVPVLGSIPPIRTDVPPERKSIDGFAPQLVSFSRPGSEEAEAIRAVRRELAAAVQDRGHQVIPVTSPDAGDGKSVLAANLAISLAQSGKRVILVDSNLGAPKMQDLFRIGRLGDSLKSIMAADVDLRVAVRLCEVPNLFLLPAGRAPMNALDLLTRPKFRELIAELKSQYEFVILDAPPVAAEQEFAVLASQADGVVLAVRSGPSAISRSDWAADRVIVAGTKLIGAVINDSPVASVSEQPAALPPPEPAVPVTPGTKPG